MCVNEGCNLFAKEPIDRDRLINKLGLNIKDVLFVNQANDWLKRKKENVVIEYNGVLGDDDDEYPGFYYYSVSIFEKHIKVKFAELKDNSIIVDIE